MSAVRQLNSFQYKVELEPERTSGVLTFTITAPDTNGVLQPVPAADLSAILFKLYEKSTLAIINSRNGVDVKNANGGSMHVTSGLFTMTLDPADFACMTANDEETHVARFVVQWSAGNKQRPVEFLFPVRNLALHP